MSEEEKKAIERSKKWIEFYRLREKTNYDFLFSIKEKDIPINEIEIALNLIDKQQETLRKQSYTNKKMRNKIKTVRKERNKLQKELENNKNDIKDAKDILGNYKHLTFPDVEETREQEEIVDRCFCKLNEILDKE